MTTTTFDTLKYFNKMKSAGIPEEQAQVQAEALRELIEGQLVTKNYLDIRLAELKNDLLKWIIGLSFAQMALIVALVAFLK